MPAADLDMLLTCKSSKHTITWFLLIALEVLCSVILLYLYPQRMTPPKGVATDIAHFHWR